MPAAMARCRGGSGSTKRYVTYKAARTMAANGITMTKGNLALLWQIYSRCFLLQIHFLQRGHRCGGGRAMSSRMAWRTAGNVGRGGGPLILFFPPCCFNPAVFEESLSSSHAEA